MSGCTFDSATPEDGHDTDGIAFESKSNIPNYQHVLLGISHEFTARPDLSYHAIIDQCTFADLQSGVHVMTAEGTLRELPTGFGMRISRSIFRNMRSAGVIQRAYGPVFLRDCEFSGKSLLLLLSFFLCSPIHRYGKRRHISRTCHRGSLGLVFCFLSIYFLFAPPDTNRQVPIYKRPWKTCSLH